jgi:hypothetical protein
MSAVSAASDDALRLWRGKLADYERELAISSDSGRKFELKQRIEECQQQILRLESSVESRPACASPDAPSLNALPRNVPIPFNPFFTGREQTLRGIECAFKASKAAALCGLGGVGKTQTAARYAYLHRDQYKAVLWLGAASREGLVSGLAALAA